MAGIGVGGIMQGVASLGNLGLGIYNTIKGNKEYKKAQSFFEKNKFAIPESAKAALGVAQKNAQSVRLPGQDIAEAKIGQATASGLEQARRMSRTPSDMLMSLSNLYASQMNAEQNLALQGAQQYQSNQRNLQGALGTMANLENERWKYNVLYPYQQMLGRASGFATQGAQQISSGVQGIVGMGGAMEANSIAEARLRDYLKTFGGSDATQGSSYVPSFANNAPNTTFTPYGGINYNGRYTTLKANI